MGDWTINLDTSRIEDSEKGTNYTEGEFHAHPTPPCPECGTPVQVEPIVTDSLGSTESDFQPYNAECDRCGRVLRG